MAADIPPTEFIAQQDNVGALPGGPPNARPRGRTNSTSIGNDTGLDQAEIQNERAVQVLNRVKEKLTGHDFKPEEELSIINQVDKLLVEATKLENLCQHYIGWCSFW
jgi:FKBP12-rapamycin complex-associated protein